MPVSPQKPSKKKTNCKICHKEFEYSSFIQTDEWRRTLEEIPSCCSEKCKEEMRQKKLLEKIPELLQEASVPTKYREIKTDKVKLLTEIVNNKKSIYSWGSAGTGKTVFVCSVIKKMLWKYQTYNIKFISSPELIMELQDLYRKEGESAWDYLREVTRKNVLILDDLGAAKMTDFVRQALYYLINEREQWCLQTIITSNYSLTQLDEFIDGRISSRIAGMCKVVEFTGKDKRLTK
jgi:DNA replication protein DnaC